MSIYLRIYRKIFKRSFLQNKISNILLFALVLNIFFGVLFYFAERDVQEGLTLLDAIWWAMVTMTTVGYGDYYAQTSLGRFLISYPIMIIGIGIIGYLVGAVAENMLDRFSKRKRGFMQIKFKDHLIICNFPGTDKVKRLIKELQYSDTYTGARFVLICDSIEELPEELIKLEVSFIRGNPVKEEILMKANITECQGIFILAKDPADPDSDSRTFAIGTIIEMIERDIKKAIKVVVEMVSKDNQKMMARSRVDGIVSADGIMDGLIVQEFLYSGVHDIIHQIITNAVGSQFYIFKTRLHGFKISDIQIAVLKHPENIQVIGIRRNNKNILNPDKSFEIQKDDSLIILADESSDFENIEEDLLNERVSKP